MMAFDAFSSGLQLELGTSNMQLFFRRTGSWFEGPRTALPSVQRVLGFKRRAVSNARSRTGSLNRRPQTESLNKIISGQAHWGRLSGQAIWNDVMRV